MHYDMYRVTIPTTIPWASRRVLHRLSTCMDACAKLLSSTITCCSHIHVDEDGDKGTCVAIVTVRTPSREDSTLFCARIEGAILALELMSSLGKKEKGK